MQTLLLLHGAIGAIDQLEPLANELNPYYNVHMLNFPGHGGEEFAEEPFSIALFAQHVLAYMNEKGLNEVNIFGYSMGGYVAMYIAKHYPNKVFKVITLGTKFHWDEHIANRETLMLDPHQIEIKVSYYADTLKQRHGHNEWILVLQRTCEMMLEMGKNNTLKKEDYTNIYTPVLLLLGDRDKMVSCEETLIVYKELSNGQMSVLPNTPHPMEKVDTSLLSFFIKRFI